MSTTVAGPSNKKPSLPEVLQVRRADHLYNGHAYLTKVPVAAIIPYIEAFTGPGDVVADPFAGSGMTGLAAALTGRAAELSDISVLGQHISQGYLTDVDPDALRAAAARCLAETRARAGDLYMTERSTDRAEVEMVKTVWSCIYACPTCEAELTYCEAPSETFEPPTACASCGEVFVRRRWRRSGEVPVRVFVPLKGNRQHEQDFGPIDQARIEAARIDARLAKVPSLPINADREMYRRSGLGKAGLTETAQFFSDRNAIALFELSSAIDRVEDADLRKKLRFAFTGMLPRASRRYQWNPKRPTNAQNQTYYIAAVYYEWNVFKLFEARIKAVLRADTYLEEHGAAAGRKRRVSYHLASADKLEHLADASIDYIYTDPPFGSSLFYSDMSLFHEAWLGKMTDESREAVVHTTGARKAGAPGRYLQLLKGAFAEAHRVLKPGGKMSVVFGNSDGRMWSILQSAMREAGFSAAPIHVAILDKGQRSVKGLASGSEGVVTVDLVMTVEKPRKDEHPGLRVPTAGDTQRLVMAAIAELPRDRAKNPSHLYGRIVKTALQNNMLLDDLHLRDVLIALREAGYSVDRKSGLLLESA